jgi:hypothetical protein
MVALAGAFRVGILAHIFRGLLRTAVEGGVCEHRTYQT